VRVEVEVRRRKSYPGADRREKSGAQRNTVRAVTGEIENEDGKKVRNVAAKVTEEGEIR
jgi:hypothetical protein